MKKGATRFFIPVGIGTTLFRSTKQMIVNFATKVEKLFGSKLYAAHLPLS